MINEIKQLNEVSLNAIIPYLNQRRLFPVELKNELGAEELNNGHGSFFITPFNKLFTRIVVQISNDNISSVLFFGNFEIDFELLTQLFGQFRKVYVAHDDQYEYFFNEDKIKNKFVIKTFSKNDYNKTSNWNVKNVQIRW